MARARPNGLTERPPLPPGFRFFVPAMVILLSLSPVTRAASTVFAASHDGVALGEQQGVLSVSLAPAKTVLALTAGASRTFPAFYRAGGNLPVRATATSRDAVPRTEGGFEFRDPGREFWSAGSWVKVEPAEFDVAPGGRQDLRVTVSVPPGTPDGEYYAAFAVTTKPGESSAPGMNVQIGGAIVSVIYITVGEEVGRSAELVPYGEVPKPSGQGPISWTRLLAAVRRWWLSAVVRDRNVAALVEGRPLVVFVPLENTGKTHIQPRITATLYRGETQLRSVTYEGDVIVPGGIEAFEIRWWEAPLYGRLRLALLIEYGGDRPITAERSFLVLPVKGILGLVLLAYGLGYLSARRAGRTKRGTPSTGILA